MLDAAAAALLHVTLLQLQKPLSLTLQLPKRFAAELAAEAHDAELLP